jgi:hypothetical protein
MLLVGIPEGKRPFGCHKHGWEVNIEVNFKEVGLGGWELTGYILLNTGTNGRLL